MDLLCRPISRRVLSRPSHGLCHVDTITGTHVLWFKSHSYQFLIHFASPKYAKAGRVKLPQEIIGKLYWNERPASRSSQARQPYKPIAFPAWRCSSPLALNLNSGGIVESEQLRSCQRQWTILRECLVLRFLLFSGKLAKASGVARPTRVFLSSSGITPPLGCYERR